MVLIVRGLDHSIFFEEKEYVRCIATSKEMVSKEEKRNREKYSKKSVNVLFSFEGANLQKKRESGDDSKEDPPVPMPNTEVKLLNVDGSWWATARESR